MRQAPIDGGKPFDWNRAATDYAAWRDIYPPDFYQKLLDAGFCGSGARVLDLGTGTGVLPRALYPHGARFTGIDASPRQIEEAKRLAAASGMDIDFRVMKAEALEFPPASFEEATACSAFSISRRVRCCGGCRASCAPAGGWRFCIWPGSRRRIQSPGRARD